MTIPADPPVGGNYPPCTDAIHDLIRSDLYTWEHETYHRGFQDNGDGGLVELRTCRRCGTTLTFTK